MRTNATLLAALALAVGCGGTAQLTETSPVHVTAAAPAPVAEPAPEPEPEPVHHVAVTDDHIEVDQRINFGFNSDEIDTSSYGLLDEIVGVLREHADIQQLRIEGHTDNVGRAEYNVNLSGRRAAAIVQYLTANGIEPSRLSSEGYGAGQPRASNDTEAGRAENRRVEFTILERTSTAGDAS